MKIFWIFFEKILLNIIVLNFYFIKNNNSKKKIPCQENHNSNPVAICYGGLPRPKKLWFDFLYKPREAKYFEEIQEYMASAGLNKKMSDEHPRKIVKPLSQKERNTAESEKKIDVICEKEIFVKVYDF